VKITTNNAAITNRIINPFCLQMLGLDPGRRPGRTPQRRLTDSFNIFPSGIAIRTMMAEKRGEATCESSLSGATIRFHSRAVAAAARRIVSARV
jgi:hypothetical protein